MLAGLLTFFGLLMTLQSLMMGGNLREVVKRFTLKLSSKRRTQIILRDTLIWKSKLYIKKINIQLYIKRDDFPFSLVRVSHFTSNIPSKKNLMCIWSKDISSRSYHQCM